MISTTNSKNCREEKREMSTETAYVEVEPEIKRRAEEILGKIGMSYSMAVDLFTRQIVLRRAFPIELKLPESKPLRLESMTAEKLDNLSTSQRNLS